MKLTSIGFGIVALLTGAGIAAQQRGEGASAEELLGKGLHQEQVEGDCRSAVATYKEVPSRPGAMPDTVGRALLQLGRCYEKLGRPGEAQAAYQQVVTVMPAGSPAHSAARAKLAPRQEAGGDPLSGRVIDAYFQGASQVAASPTGRLVAYTKPKPGRSTLMLGEKTDIPMLYVRDLSTGQERLLVDPQERTELITRISWAPDESAIAYVVQLIELDPSKPAAKLQGWLRDLRVVAVQTGVVSRVAAGQGSFLEQIRWSPDSRHLAFDSRKADLSPGAKDDGLVTVTVWNRALGTTKDLGITRRGRIGQPAPGLAWSPDGNLVAYIAAESGGKHVTLAARGGDAVSTVALPPTPEGASPRLAGWHASGELIVVQNIPRIGNDFYMVPANGRPARKVCEGRGVSGGDGCTAPNATTPFLVARRTSEGGRAFLRDLAGGSERSLTDAAVLEQPFLLPGANGKLIAFRSDRDGDFGVYLAPVDQLPARKPLRIATLDSATSTASGWWTPDGLVLTMSRSDANIYRVDIDLKTGRPTSGPKRLTNNAASNLGPAPSPDGKHIAYRLRDRQTGIGLMDANGANERLLLPVPPDLLNSVGTIGWRTPAELLLHGARVTGPANISSLAVQTSARTALSQPDIQGSGLTYVPASNEIFYWNLQRNAEGSPNEVWARSLATGADRFVYQTPDAGQFFKVASDGSRLIYTYADEDVGDGRPIPIDIRIVDLKTGTERVALSFPDSQGVWNVTANALRGSLLLYQDPHKAQRILNIETGESWPLLTEDLPGVEVEMLSGVWSPDGSYVLFTGFSQRVERRQWTGLTYDTVVKLMQKR